MFTKRKFLTLSPERQHKKCAEMLRSLYENKEPHLLQSYNSLQTWINADPLENPTPQAISNQYHWHLNQARQQLQEHSLLPLIEKGDKARGAEPWPIAIYLDHIRSAHNVGSIVRTCEALSLGTLYFSAQTPKLNHPQVIKTSMNAHQWVNTASYTSLDELPKPLIALETSPEATPLHRFIFPQTFTLIIGNEEYGCSDEILQKADHIVSIPMRGHKNSLNVANAFAITAAEIHRQRSLHEKDCYEE